MNKKLKLSFLLKNKFRLIKFDVKNNLINFVFSTDYQ